MKDDKVIFSLTRPKKALYNLQKWYINTRSYLGEKYNIWFSKYHYFEVNKNQWYQTRDGSLLQFGGPFHEMLQPWKIWLLNLGPRVS
jgi:hypothetical protein